MAARYARSKKQASELFTLDKIKNETRMPEPYAQPFKKTINQASAISAVFPCTLDNFTAL